MGTSVQWSNRIWVILEFNPFNLQFQSFGIRDLLFCDGKDMSDIRLSKGGRILCGGNTECTVC